MSIRIAHAALAACVVLLSFTPALVRAQTASSADSVAESPSEVVVTATRADQGIPYDLLGSSVTVIGPADLQQRQTRLVSDVLRDVPGVDVSRSGPIGQVTQVRIRGAESNHTLTLIDGIKASDPYFGEFDYATLMADDIARIEVLRGQQSALYGSDAIGGVINYITLGGREAPGVRARLEGGSFGSIDTSARAAGLAGPLDYAFSGGYQSARGVPDSVFGTRDLGSNNQAASTRLVYAPTDAFHLQVIARYSRTHAQTNEQDFNFPPDATYGYVVDGQDSYTNRAFYGLVRAELASFAGHWTNAASVQGMNARRENYTADDDTGGDRGKRLRASYESTVHLGSDAAPQALTAAFDYERESFQNVGLFLSPQQSLDRHSTARGIVLQYQASLADRIGIGGAIRHDDNDLFANDNTYRVQGSYRFDGGLRLRAAAGSGTRNPGIFELFGYDPQSFIGNPNLRPETSHGWEVGVEQSLSEGRVLLGATWFDSRLKNQIFTEFLPGFVSTVANDSTDSTQRGLELTAHAQPADGWTVDASYTHLRAREAGVEEVRRPPNTASLNVGWRGVQNRLGFALTVRYNGATYDNNFTLALPDPRVRLQSFTLVNIGADWRLTEHLQLYGRAENLTDERYQEVYTYRTAGRGGFIGARLTY